MSDITASERRLSAALDRLDQLLEAGPGPVADDPQAVADLTRRLQEAESRADLLEQDRSAAPPLPQMLTDLQTQLEAVTEQAARLSQANEDLTAANRNLIDAQATGGIGEDERRDALEAEISALRAARAAEMAQMSEIMTELERLLADSSQTDGEPAAGPASPADPDSNDKET